MYRYTVEFEDSEGTVLYSTSQCGTDEQVALARAIITLYRLSCAKEGWMTTYTKLARNILTNLDNLKITVQEQV